MKPKLFFLTLSCLLLFAATSQAQMQMAPQTPQSQPSIDAFNRMLQTPMGQAVMRNGIKTGIRSFWEGNGASLMAIGLAQDPEVRTALDLSDEQFQQIQTPPGMEMFTNPEMRSLMEEMQALGPNLAGMFTGQEVDAETQTRFLNIQSRMTSLTVNLMADRIDNLLTSEQKQKIQEAQLASMSEVPIVSIDAFEVLNLTDAQRQQMEAIKQELEPEFESNLEDVADGAMIMVEKLFAEIERQEEPLNFLDQGAMQERMQVIQRRLMEDPEYKRIQDEMNAQSQAFSTQLRTRMFDVLTDEQWARLQELIDNPPAHAALMLRKLREQRGETEQAAEQPGGNFWQPGPGSWRPGDAIPEVYRIERNTRRPFPRTEN